MFGSVGRIARHRMKIPHPSDHRTLGQALALQPNRASSGGVAPIPFDGWV
jgi:hypothetical protein